MNTDKLLHQLTSNLDAVQSTLTTYDAYENGTQALAFLAPEARTALGTRFGRMASNIPRLVISSLAERLRINDFTGVSVWDDWISTDMDQKADLVHRDALTYGRAYCMVWADRAGNPLISPESARQVTVQTDPATGAVTSALKRWSTATTTEAVVYLPTEIRRYSAPVVGATSGGFKLTETIPNPLGVVPVVPFVNSNRLLDTGYSEIDDLMPLVDLLNKELADLAVASEYTARPRRWSTGIELVDDEETGEAINPIPEGNRALVAENENAKFGQLAGANLDGYSTAVRVIQEQIMAVSTLPAHYLGILTNQPASADALRASEAALTARVEAKQKSMGRSWEQVANLVSAVRGGSSGARVVWNDPSTRSIAAEADATVKLVQAGVLPVSYALKRLGYSADEIAEIRLARRTEAIDAAPLRIAGGAA